MAQSLAQSALLTQDKLKKGVIEEIIRRSPILARLPFETIVGNALAINREDEDNPATVAWRQVNGVWTESTGQVTQHTFSLKILGGDADVDKFIQQTRSNVNDQMATQVKMKTKAMVAEFEDTFLYGSASGTDEFNGLHNLVDADQVIKLGADATGAALTTPVLDQLIDMVTNGDVDCLLMNKNIRRRLTTYLRTVGSYTTTRDDYGKQWAMWGDVPILTTDYLLQTEALAAGAYSAKTGGATSSIFALRFDAGDGLVGIQNGDIQTEVFEKLETKDAMRTRLKWYVGLALMSTKAIAAITGVTDAPVAS